MKTMIASLLFILLNRIGVSSKENLFTVPEEFKIQASFSIGTQAYNSVQFALAKEKKALKNNVSTCNRDTEITALKLFYFKNETIILDYFFNKQAQTVPFLFDRTEDRKKICQVYELKTNICASFKKYLKEDFKTVLKNNTIKGVNHEEFVFNCSISHYKIFQFNKALYFVDKEKEKPKFTIKDTFLDDSI